MVGIAFGLGAAASTGNPIIGAARSSRCHSGWRLRGMLLSAPTLEPAVIALVKLPEQPQLEGCERKRREQDDKDG